MDSVDAFLREIEDGATLGPRTTDDRARRPSQIRQPFSYSRTQDSRQAQPVARTQTLEQYQQPRYGRQDRACFQPELDDQGEIPLDAFGQFQSL